MLTADNHEPSPYQPSERVKAIEGHIVQAATHYKQGQFPSTIDLLDGNTDQSSEFAQQHGISFSHPNIPIELSGQPENLTDPKFLPTIINTFLLESRPLKSSKLILPNLDLYLNDQPISETDWPILWKKVHALTLLEEWVHELHNSMEQGKNLPPASLEESENQAALYLHNLGIKLPKYFLEGYERSSLKLPVEDHDFDSIEL